jgi:hypothetical protein
MMLSYAASTAAMATGSSLASEILRERARANWREGGCVRGGMRGVSGSVER